MKLCLNCLAELFDRETICPICKSVNLINNDELKQIQHDLSNASKYKRTRILRNLRYQRVNDYNSRKRNNRKPPEILEYSHANIQVNPSYELGKSVDNNITLDIICPYCKSNKCSRISILGRVVSVEFWGLASNKLGKQWHCEDCGSNF